ncbi:MAG TPA: LOG family protein [Nevskiaceae bacterium]|nr:LOG family protein [Nevskiaceae bacterium]
MRLHKAYKNPEFLMSEEARSVRILCEYLEPERRFRRLGIERAVIFFGSARITADSPTYRDAAALAEQLARWTQAEHRGRSRYHIVSGGGPGIMAAAHEGAARVDRRLNIGLNISLPFEQHVNPHLETSQALEFHYFFMRKFWFLNLARAAVIFPGGFGTLDELFELLTLTQTGKSAPMPILLYDRAFWEEVVNFPALARRGLISAEDLSLFAYADRPDEAFARLREGLTAPAA